MRRSARLVVRTLTVGVALAVAVAGCTKQGTPPPPPLTLNWQEVALPAAPPGQSIMLRAATVCDGHWYVVGAYRTEALRGTPDETRPAAWTSTDGHTWTPMAFAFSGRNYWATVAVLYSAACRNGHLVTIGAKPGGAHGNPRVMTFYPVPAADGTDVLTEEVAYFGTYGGDSANNVSWLRAGPDGFLITGNRSSGAAVWTSADGVEFDLLEGAPVLAVADGETTWAADAVAVDGGWLVVGGALGTGRVDRDAAAWQSADGQTWQRVQVPHDDTAYDEMSLVTIADGDVVAVGRDGAHFQSWRRTAGSWVLGGAFGEAVLATATPGGPLTVPYPIDLAASGGLLLTAAISSGVIDLFASTDHGVSWRPAQAPVPTPAGADQDVVLAAVPAADGAPDRMLLATDNGASIHLFIGDVPAGR